MGAYGGAGRAPVVVVVDVHHLVGRGAVGGRPATAHGAAPATGGPRLAEVVRDRPADRRRTHGRVRRRPADKLRPRVPVVGVTRRPCGACRCPVDPFPLIPAVTFPIWQTVYLWVAVLVSVVIHEIGHAACAIVYDVPITRIGVASVFLIPIAFVEIDQQRLEERSHVARQVASAGILHNVALAVLCRMLISLLPVLLLPLYSSGARPIISWISPESPLYANVTAGCDAVVASLNGVPVTSAASLQDHLSGMAVGPPGLCMDRSAIDASRLRFGSECCNSSTAPGHCFQADDSTPPFCVASRDVLPSRPIQCVQRDQCKAAGDRCVAPSAQDQRVVYIDIHTRTLIFVGDPLLLGATMEVTDLQPRLPGVVPVRGPIVVAEFLRLAMSVSTSLAFVNAAPVNYFDGEHLAMAFLTPSSNGAALVESALHIGSLCLIANVILGVAVKLLAR